MASMVGRAGVSALRKFETGNPAFLCRRIFASAPRCRSLQPPNVPLLADCSRISLSPTELKDFAPKIHRVIDWFGQLQAVDLECVKPSFHADTEANADLREDLPETFINRKAILASVPSFDDPYIKVPKVLNRV